MRICIVTPAPPRSRHGNRITALPDEIVGLRSADLSDNPIPAAEKARIRKLWSAMRKGTAGLRF